jgi:hypothetical protein
MQYLKLNETRLILLHETAITIYNCGLPLSVTLMVAEPLFGAPAPPRKALWLFVLALEALS